jgi:Family of unknown function (DUF6204)
MSSRTFRITVRGAFDQLSAEQRAQLLAESDEHDLLRAAFTADGHLSYDIAARPFFTFRIQDEGETEADLARAIARAQATAEAWLTGRGYGFKNLTAQGEDLALAPLSKRQRRAAAGA